MASRMWAVVDTTMDRPPRGATLIRSANLLPVGDGEWINGLRWQPLACGDGTVLVPTVCGQFDGFGDPPAPPDNVDYVPLEVAAGARCSTGAGEQAIERATTRATALLEQCETVAIAGELWSGTAAGTSDEDLPNDYLANPDTLDVITEDPQPLVVALALLEQGLARCSCGGVGVIHASPFTASLWFSTGAIERTADGRLSTGLGNLVIADPGYDGSGPDGDAPVLDGNAWAYATNMIDVRRGTVATAGDRTTMDRAGNNFEVFAHRAFAATFDPCCHLGITVDHTVRD